MAVIKACTPGRQLPRRWPGHYPSPMDKPAESQIYNVNVTARTILPPPAQVKAEYPLTPALEGFILRSRRTLQNIIDARDPRLFVVVGPCSIHDTAAALDYARRL